MSTVAEVTLEDVSAFFWAERGRRGQGIAFDCPLCVSENKKVSERGLIALAFENPLDGGARITNRTIFWKREGTTLINLTLDKDIDASKQWHGTHRGWRGSIKNGRIT